ncbi:MAG TPA: hypothetical protein VFM86_06535 [Pedococcus sp.]|nr:hypothetical protein [Pedococcus sp.]
MERSARARPAGSAPSLLSAGATFVTAAIYVAAIVSQGSVDVVATLAIAAWIVALGACALAGGLRTAPDRVIPIGVATGGLFGAAVLSLFSIGLLLLVAAICALVAWIRAGVEASSSQQALGGILGVVAAVGFLALVAIV